MKKPFKFSIGKGKKGRIIGFKLGGEEEERREELRDPLFFYVITAFWIDVIVFCLLFFPLPNYSQAYVRYEVCLGQQGASNIHLVIPFKTYLNSWYVKEKNAREM